jgi:hypothetical protein
VALCCFYSCRSTAVQGRSARRGDLVTRITVTSSILNFSTRYIQCVTHTAVLKFNMCSAVIFGAEYWHLLAQVPSYYYKLVDTGIGSYIQLYNTKRKGGRCNSCGGLVDFFGARGTRAHVRNVPSSVLPKSTVRNPQKTHPHAHPPNTGGSYYSKS